MWSPRTNFILLAMAFSACGADRNAEVTDDSTRNIPKVDPRDAWLKPDVLVDMMGRDLSGMVVADLFAEDGYFTFRLVGTGASVIAVVNDPANADLLEFRKRELGLSDEQLQIRTVPVGDVGLAPDEVDAALLVHHFVTMPDRDSYFALLRRGMRSPRPLFLVEWQGRPTQLGPPPNQRMGSEAVMDELGRLGFTDIGAFSDKLPDQVLYFASDPMEELEGQ